MKDSFLKKVTILAIGVFSLIGFLAADREATAQIICEDCCPNCPPPDTCFDDCYRNNPNGGPCCGQEFCDLKLYCEVACACGNGQVDACEECDGGENCSEDCKNVAPPANDPPPPITPVMYKGQPYLDWLALEKAVNTDMNIEPDDPIMAAVKGISFVSPSTDIPLKASVIGKNAWAALTLYFENNGEYPPGQNSVPMSNNNCLGPITQPSICMVGGSFVSCQAKGCRELSKSEWQTATTTSPQICPTNIGCCNQAAVAGSAAYTTRCTVPDTFPEPNHNDPDGRY